MSISAASEVSVINADALLPGDIILSTGVGKKSWMIRTATLGSFSHAALHIGCGIAVEANDPGVIPVFLPAVSYEASSRILVRRVKALSADEQNALVDFVWSLLYRPYSTKGAVGTLLPFLRQQADPGYFCSQLAAAAYESVGLSICDGRPSECTPAALATSPHLSDVPSGVRSVKSDTHAALANLLGSSYAAYLKDGNLYEKTILATSAKALPKPPFAEPFNLYDLIRQLRDGSVDTSTSQTWDVVIAGLIKNVVGRYPLAACPGIGVTSFMLETDNWLVPVFSPEWDKIVQDRQGNEYYKQFVTQLFTASNWEVNHWLHECERMISEADKLNCESFKALGMWIGLAATNRYQYAALLRNTREPGFLSPAEKEKIKARLREMKERHNSQSTD